MAWASLSDNRSVDLDPGQAQALLGPGGTSGSAPASRAGWSGRVRQVDEVVEHGCQ